MDRTCRTCRHHSEARKPRPQQPIVDADADYVGVVFSDTDEVMYSCRAPRGDDAPHAGREVGFDPVTCEAYSAGSRISDEQRVALDEAQARLAARLASRARREE